MNTQTLKAGAAALIVVLYWAGTVFGIDSVTLRGGDMQHRIALGMTEHELVGTVGAPDIVKNAGRCYYYRLWDVSIMLDESRRIVEIYAGREFSGAIIKDDGSEAPVGDIFMDFGEPLVTVRQAYAPSSAIASAATTETEYAPAASGGADQALPLEYRGHKKLYELYSGSGVIKYKYVLDEDGIAFWLDAEKKPYATVIYRTAPAEQATVAQAEPDEGVIVYFDFDRDELKDDYVAALARLGRRMQEDVSLCVSIEGHADAFGTNPYNDALSGRRARRVHDFLVAQGVPAAHMHIATFGKRVPAAANSTPDGRDNPEGRALNRRVQIRQIACER